MKCKCKDKCKHKLRILEDKENPEKVQIKIGWFSWVIVDKKELRTLLNNKTK